MRRRFHIGSILFIIGGALVPWSAGVAQINYDSHLITPTRKASDRPRRTFSGQDGTWAWLQRYGVRDTLFGRGQQGGEFQIATGKDWEELAVDGDTVWVLERNGSVGSLLRVALTPGANPQTVRTGLHEPGGLLAQNGRVYWLQTDLPSSGTPTYVPTTGPMLRLQVREKSGAVRTLGAWPGGSDIQRVGAAGDLIGEAGGAVWARVRRRCSTELVRFPLTGSGPERVVGALGTQQAVLRGTELFWTAPSPEAAQAGRVSVYRLGSKGPELVTDWLPKEGTLLSAAGGIYYAQDQLYRVATPGGLPRPLRQIRADRTATDGTSVVQLTESMAPTRLTLQPE